MGQQGDSKAPARRIGRPPIGDRPMTGAEREAKRRVKMRQAAAVESAELTALRIEVEALRSENARLHADNAALLHRLAGHTKQQHHTTQYGLKILPRGIPQCT